MLFQQDPYRSSNSVEEIEVINYYNIEKSPDNPYVVILTECEVENLSDNFKVSNNTKSAWSTASVIQYSRNKGHNTITAVDTDTVSETLQSYKEQLISNKVTITDTNLTSLRTLCTYVKELFDEVGLSVHRDSTITLKRERKPKKQKPTGEINIPKSRINNYFSSIFRQYLHKQLGITATLRISSKDLYPILNKFKHVFPTTTYRDLTESHTHSWYGSSILGLAIAKRCEEIWNNPNLAKQPQPKEKVAK